MEEKSNWLEYWVDPHTWEFRGDFEGMYRDFGDPWRCQQNVSELRRDVSLMMLLRGRHYQRILDIGCGLGAFTDRLRIMNGDAETILGVDISPTAVKKARAQFPKCSFDVLNAMSDPLPQVGSKWGLVLVSELIWYVLPGLQELLARIYASLGLKGVLFIQQFYPSVQKFGLEFLRSPADLCDRYLVTAGFRRETEFIELVSDGQVQLLTLTKSELEG